MFSASGNVLGLLFLSFLAYGISSSWSRTARGRPLPPGPRGIPLLGNILNIRSISKSPWLKFTEWFHQYGPVVYMNFAGHPVIILNTAQAAFDLLDQQGANYANRPHLIMASEILTGGIHVGFVPHGPLWRKLRKAAHLGLNRNAVQAYFPVQEKEAVLLIKSIIETPTDWDRLLQTSAASTILSIVYGMPPVQSHKDPIILRLSDFMERMLKAAMPGNYLVDILPILNKFPPWIAKFKREGSDAHQEFTAMFSEFLRNAKSVDSKADMQSTFGATLIEQQTQIGMTEKETAWLAGAMLGAGSDTTAAALSVFVLAMVLYPQVMRKAQSEIDAVCHDCRPRMKDRDRLPYIVAIVKETLRWKPITPLGLARRAAEDYIYNGYLIPKDSIIMTNVWAMNYNEDVYPDPAEFMPERFLTIDGIEAISPTYTRTGTHAYGFGRRICAGLNIANNSLFINIASLLWAFEFAPLDSAHPPTPDDHVDTGVIVRPAPFKCRLTPRARKNVKALLD